MAGILQFALSTVVAAFAMGALGWIVVRAGSRRVDHATRRIAPNRVVIWACAVGCWSLGGFAIYAALFHGGGAPALFVGVPFTAFGVTMLCSLSPRMDVIWDPLRMEGPASYGVPPFGPKRATMAFADITEVGVDVLGSLYAVDAKGNKVRWSQYYSGYSELTDHIAEVRPDLVDPDAG